MSTADVVEIVIDCVCVLGAIIAIITGIINAHRVHDVHDEVVDVEVDEASTVDKLKEIIYLQEKIIDELKENKNNG